MQIKNGNPPNAPAICGNCGDPARLHVYDIESRNSVKVTHLCEKCAKDYLSKPGAGPRRAMSSSEVEVDVCRIVINDVAPEQILYFREVDGERGLPFVLGIYEATSILRMLEGERTSRPLTHEAWLLTIETIGGKVAESAITRLVDRTYHAELRIANQSEIVRVDVRPSDAVAIALKANAPILIKAELLPEVAS